MYRRRSNPNCNGNRRDKVALRTTGIKKVKFKIIKIRTGCENVGYFYHSENLNWAAQNFRLGCMRPAVGHSCSKPIENVELFIVVTTVLRKFHASQMPSSKEPHLAREPQVPDPCSKTPRGLVMPGVISWLDAPHQILVLSSGVWWSLLLDIRWLWRHIVTSYSGLQPTFCRSLLTQHA